MKSNDYCPKIIQTMFTNKANKDIDLDNIFNTHFTSIDSSEIGYGNEIFSITSKLARFLLHNLKHETPNEDKIKKILRYKAKLAFDGMGSMWSGDPIIIKDKDKEIENGVLRLYAIALLDSNNGVYCPMVLKD